GVFVRRHQAAAVPTLIADAHHGHAVGRGVAIGGAQLGQRGRLVGGHVFHPVLCLGHAAGADVERDIGLGADLLGEVHELVGAEGVGVDHVAPGRIDAGGALGANAVTPVVAVGIAAAGPAHVRYLD